MRYAVKITYSAGEETVVLYGPFRSPSAARNELKKKGWENRRTGRRSYDPDTWIASSHAYEVAEIEELDDLKSPRGIPRGDYLNKKV